MKEHIRRIIIRSLFVTVISMSFLAASGRPARADQASERADLRKLIHELNELEPQIKQAEAAAVSTQRVHFQYQWLRADLRKIKSGILAYLDTVPTTLRTVPPLAGDYIR